MPSAQYCGKWQRDPHRDQVDGQEEDQRDRGKWRASRTELPAYCGGEVDIACGVFADNFLQAVGTSRWRCEEVFNRHFRKWSAGVGDSTLLMGSCR